MSSGLLNFEYVNISGYGLSDWSVGGTLERTLDRRRCSRCDKLAALDQA